MYESLYLGKGFVSIVKLPSQKVVSNDIRFLLILVILGLGPHAKNITLFGCISFIHKNTICIEICTYIHS